MNNCYKPNGWVVIKIGDSYRLFAAWAGGYLEQDSWRVNSGITRVTQDENYYYFYGHSGSCYQCHKNTYGSMTFWCKGVLTDLLNGNKGKRLEDRDDWEKFLTSEINNHEKGD